MTVKRIAYALAATMLLALAFPAPAKSEQSGESWMRENCTSSLCSELLERLLERKPMPVMRPVLGCQSQDIFLNILERAKKLVKAGDSNAVYRLFFEHVANGDCIILKEGTMVISDKEEMNSVYRIVCLRAVGDDACYWANWDINVMPDDGVSKP